MAQFERNRRTILVVDDEPEVRSSMALLLETLGYLVLEASDARTALSALDENGAVDLLLTDLVLPGGVTGADLARQALARRRDLKVLLTTGRPELAEGETFALIGKPFRMADLARRIEEVMVATD